MRSGIIVSEPVCDLRRGYGAADGTTGQKKLYLRGLQDKDISCGRTFLYALRKVTWQSRTAERILQ